MGSSQLIKAISRGCLLTGLLLVGGGAMERRGMVSVAEVQAAALMVTVPEQATIVRKQGKPTLTGQLTGFNSDNLRISALGYSKSVPLAEAKEINFNGDIWVEGRRLPARIRGYVKSWTGVSISALKLLNPIQFANIDLNGVEAPEELQRLLKDRDKERVLSKLRFDSPRTMTVETFTIPKP
jgi:hypothetical protein